MNPETWLEKNIIFEAIIGSQAYGLSTPESDTDYRGVAISPPEYYLGLHNFEQKVSKEPDRTIFDIKKFTDLAIKGNPNILEFFFISQDCLIYESEHWKALKQFRSMFLTKKVKHTYTGYAYSQLKRVKSHRHWLLNPILEKPTRAAYGLPDPSSMSKELMGSIEHVIKESLKFSINEVLAETADEITKSVFRNYFEFDIREVLEDAFSDFVFPVVANNLNNMLDVVVAVGEDHFKSDVMVVFAKEKTYAAAMSNWKQYQEWMEKRNPKRAELEAKFGYDSKHMSHVFRLLLQGEEILRDGTLSVRLKPEDREFVFDVKNGKYKYEELMGICDQYMLRFEDLYKVSTLPHSANFEKINGILVNTIKDFWESQNV